MRKYGTIYKITNLKTGKSYVGQTVGTVRERFLAHYQDSRSNTYIGNALRNEGKQRFQVEELFIAFDLESLNFVENLLVEQLNTIIPNGYNLRPGGSQYGKLSQETKEKISKSKTGKPNFKKRGEIRTEEQRLQISISLGGRPILCENEDTGKKTIYLTAHETTKYGFQPWNVVACCKGKRKRHKKHKFSYLIHANQSGSTESKELVHAQRLEIEPTNVD